MGTQSDSNRLKLYAKKETTWGETPSGPAMFEIRSTGESLQHDKQTIVSNEINAGRMRTDIVEVGRGASGDISGELSYGTFSTLFEGALMNTWNASAIVATSATFAASTITLGGAATHSAASLASGVFIRVSTPSGTSNGGTYKVAAAAASSITIVGATLSAIAGVSTNIKWNYLRNGTTETSFLLEKGFLDIGAYIWFNGMEVNQLQVNVQAAQIATVVFSWLGKSSNTVSTVSINSAVTSAGTTSPMNGTGNVSAITEGGATVSAAIRSLNFTATNNLRSQQAIGNAAPIGIGLGTFEVTGTAEMYFEDGTYYNKFRNHTAASLQYRLTDSAGNTIVFTLPDIHYTSATPSAGGLDQDVFASLNFTAFKDADTNCVLQIDALN